MSWGSSCWLLQRRHLLHSLRESRQGNPPDQVLPGDEEEVGDEVMRRLARRPCDGWLPVRSRRVWCNVYRWWHGGPMPELPAWSEASKLEVDAPERSSGIFNNCCRK